MKNQLSAKTQKAIEEFEKLIQTLAIKNKENKEKLENAKKNIQDAIQLFKKEGN